MARSGIYKAEVVRARDKLLALGRYPSIDAIRIELGTGSKGTIHRYIKEIEEEEGVPTTSKVSISESLQDLVARLSERMKLEADAKIEELAAQHAKEIEKYHDKHENMQADIEGLQQSLQHTQAELVDERLRYQEISERLRDETLTRAKLEQHLADIQDRLQIEERHLKSLEEKHVLARQALEHFRSSTMEQREQLRRQHEQQVQYLQGEIRTLNQAIAQKHQESLQRDEERNQITSELAKAEIEIRETKTELRGLEVVSAHLAAERKQTAVLGRRVVELETEVVNLRDLKQEMEDRLTDALAKIQDLHIELASVKSASETENHLAEKFQAWMAQMSEAGKHKSRRFKPVGGV